MHGIWRLAFDLFNQAGIGLLLLGSAFELGLHGVLHRHSLNTDTILGAATLQKCHQWGLSVAKRGYH
ncbi:Beauvericin cluster-specific repressor BEA4 [Fusarium oxysporum f. sp. albedinis]|nr:Beauvericin cluster-specific repressor BEA4 [Fusarium oxysporum f. sp. albedinis]